LTREKERLWLIIFNIYDMELTSTHKLILNLIIKSSLDKKFYWTGGTLLSHYYLHHRLSYDLDFFTDTNFSYDTLLPFISILKEMTGIKHLEPTKIYDRWEFIIHKPESLRFEFVFYNHEKKRLSPLLAYQGILIDSLADISANKIIALFDRNEPKDLFDVYTLLVQKKYTVPQLLDLAEKKFGVKFSEFSFWSECTKSFPLLDSLKPYLFPKEKNKKDLLGNIKEFFLSQGKDYLEKEFGNR